MNRFGQLVFTCLILLVSLVSFAKVSGIKRIALSELGIQDGLSQGMVNAILQDHHGFMWFATKDGLNRYDGNKMTVFRHQANDSMSLSDNYVRSLFEDSKHRMWVGTTFGGLLCFDFETERFKRISPRYQQTYPLANELIQQMVEDGKGNLWIATGRNVWVMQEQHLTARQAPVFTLRKIEDVSGRLYADRKGSMWVSRSDGLLYTVNSHASEMQKEILYDPIKNTSHTLHHGFDYYVGAFLEDTAYQRMILITTTGWMLYDPARKQLNARPTINNSHKAITGKVACLVDGACWYAQGFNLYCQDVNADEAMTVEPGSEVHKHHIQHVTCLYQDRSGVIWIGTGGYGILKYYPKSGKFHHTDGESILGMKTTTDNRVALLKSFNRRFLFDPASRMLTEVFHEGDTLGFTPHSPVRFEDPEGNIWFRKDLAFACYQPKTKSIVCYPFPVKANPGMTLSFLQALYLDRDGIFWLGTPMGLLRFDVRHQSWKQYHHIPRDTQSLSANLVFSICPDPQQPDRFLWIGTGGGGINRFEKSSGKCIHFNSSSGLPNNTVYGILSDEQGQLWMSTNFGLSKFNPTANTFHNYQSEDGLQSNEFNRNAYCKTPDGTLYFGGVNGFNYFNPKEVNINNIAPPVLITDFRIFNKAISFTDPKRLLSRPVYLTSRIELPYESNMLSFEFAALDFAVPQKNKFKYQLLGFDHDWIECGNTNTATYTNLDPGTYFFQVMGSNHDGVWNEKPASLSIRILPPWYMTWWFRITLGSSILLAFYTLHRYRLRQAIKVEKIRNDIAQDLHDEIGSNLSSISIYAEMASIKSVSKPAEVIPLINKISEYTATSMEAMSDIVWMINSRNDRFENIIIRMRSMAAELLETKGYSLQLEVDERIHEIQLDMETRKNIYLMFKEAINNIVKYANGKSVWITILLENKRIHMTIKDDGIGFDSRVESHSNGLNNMTKRAKALGGSLSISTAPHKGTTLRFEFPVQYP